MSKAVCTTWVRARAAAATVPAILLIVSNWSGVMVPFLLYWVGLLLFDFLTCSTITHGRGGFCDGVDFGLLEVNQEATCLTGDNRRAGLHTLKGI